MSRVTAIIAQYHHRLPVMGCFVITPFPTKAQRDKNARELKRQLPAVLTCGHQRDVAALDAKYAKELADG